MQSDVVITGYRLNAKEPAQKALERILGLTPEAARSLSRSFPAVVVQGAANDNAERIRAQLENAGATVELRASRARLEHAPLDLPSPKKKQNAFDLDLDTPSQQPKTVPGPLAIPAPPRAPQQTRNGPARAPQPTSRSLRGSLPQPPPPPADAYQLGDFGMPPRGQSVVAKLPTEPASLAPPPPPMIAQPSPPTLADGDFEMEFGDNVRGGGGGLELDLEVSPRQSMQRNMSVPEVHGERFDALSGPQAQRGPDVDAQAFRSIQRARVESRRPAKKKVSLLERVLQGPLLSILVLLGVCAVTLGGVGYALDPADPIGGLARAQTMPDDEPADQVGHQEGYLHPLLRSTPRPVRAPLAAVLRARISGVHDVPVSFPSHDALAQCTLVEHGTDDTEARLAKVRETGHEVPATAEASAELIEHERAFRAQLGRPDLMFTRVCLVP